MPSTKSGSAKKKLVKAPSLKEAALKEATAKSSARKSTSGRCTTRGNKNPPSTTTASASMGDMLTGDTVPTPATTEADRDLSPAAMNTITTPSMLEEHAEITLLRAQLAAMQHELTAAQEAAAGNSNSEHSWVERPKNYKKLEHAMMIKSDDDCTYKTFCEDVARLANAAGLRSETHWYRQDVDKVARVCNMAKRQHPFLKRYASDWPVKEYLKTRFRNQRGYTGRKKRVTAAKAVEAANAAEVVEAANAAEAVEAADAAEASQHVHRNGRASQRTHGNSESFQHVRGNGEPFQYVHRNGGPSHHIHRNGGPSQRVYRNGGPSQRVYRNGKSSQRFHEDAEGPQRERRQRDPFKPVELGKRVKNINDIYDFGSASGSGSDEADEEDFMH